MVEYNTLMLEGRKHTLTHRSPSCAYPLCLEGEDMQSVTIIKTKTAGEYRAIEWIKMHPWRHVFLSLSWLSSPHFPPVLAGEPGFSLQFSSNYTSIFWPDVGPSHDNMDQHLWLFRIWKLKTVKVKFSLYSKLFNGIADKHFDRILVQPRTYNMQTVVQQESSVKAKITTFVG